MQQRELGSEGGMVIGERLGSEGSEGGERRAASGEWRVASGEL